MQIRIDADGCPVVSETMQLAKQYDIKVTIYCDTAHEIQRDGAKTVVVSKGADAVDFVLVNQLQKGDVCITQDYGLAAMALAKGAFVLDQNGKRYTNDNIGSMLEQRHFAKKLRMAGGRMKGPKKRVKEQNAAFYETLQKLIQEIKNDRD